MYHEIEAKTVVISAARELVRNARHLMAQAEDILSEAKDARNMLDDGETEAALQYVDQALFHAIESGLRSPSTIKALMDVKRTLNSIDSGLSHER